MEGHISKPLRADYLDLGDKKKTSWVDGKGLMGEGLERGDRTHCINPQRIETSKNRSCVLCLQTMAGNKISTAAWFYSPEAPLHSSLILQLNMAGINIHAAFLGGYHN